MEDKKKILFILNPAAGIKRVRDLEGIVNESLDLQKFRYEIKVTSHQGDAFLMAEEAVKEGCSTIAAVGGDGTINEIATAIEGTDVNLAVVPNGSGNGLARHLEIPLDMSEAIGVINDQKIKTIDTATMNGSTFVSIAGVGFDARVASQYRKVSRRGFYGYFRIVVLEYFGYKERPYLLEVDGQTMERQALTITIANSNQYGYGILVAPTAKLEDGLLNVVVIRKFPLTELAHILQLVFTHRIDRSHYVETITGKEIKITRNKGKWVNVDGEAVKSASTIEIKVKPSSMNVLVSK